MPTVSKYLDSLFNTHFDPLKVLLNKVLLSIVLLLPQQFIAQKYSQDSISTLIHSCLQYIKNDQTKVTIPAFNYKGEWPTYMCLQKSYPLLGDPKRYYDSNCFSVASIYNMLAEIYLAHPEFSEIKPMLDEAFPQIMSYKSQNGGFNFWPLLPASGRLRQLARNNKSDFVRRPVQYRMLMPYIRKAANIMDDNDDTAQGWLAILNNRKLNGEKSEEDFSRIFEMHRDSARQNMHYYNLCYGNDFNTGAYKTWRGEEETFPGWNIPRVLVNNALFLLPISTAYPHAYKPYMPYGANDVDAVVNANILTTLAESKSLENTVAIRAAADYITTKTKKGAWNTAGIYYPNRYHFHYTVLRAKQKGAKYLDSAAAQIENHLMNSQLEDGSYESRKRVNKRDKIQSTAYALNSLLKLGNPFGTSREIHINKALHYLLLQCYNQNNSVCWEGGVFFSGGTVIRNILVWKSDSYTTALIVESLSIYLSYLKSANLN